MATTYTTTVKPSGGDYTSLSAWEAGYGSNTGTHNGDLVTADVIEVAECYAMSDTSPVAIAGWTTDATRYIKIYTPASERHDGKYNTSKYRLEISNNNCINVGENYIRFDGLQLKNTSNNYGGGGIIATSNALGSGTSEIQISNCIIAAALSASASDNRAIDFYETGGTHVIKAWDNIIYDWVNGTTGMGIYFGGGNNLTGYAYNNTVYNCYTGYMQQYSSVFYAKNDISQACNDGFSGTFTSATNNCSDITSDAPGTNPRTGTVSFVNAGSRDLHLSSGDTVAKDYGADLSADANLAFSVDIDGETRSGTWDIGADEYVAAGGGLSIPIAIYHLRQQGIA